MLWINVSAPHKMLPPKTSLFARKHSDMSKHLSEAALIMSPTFLTSFKDCSAADRTDEPSLVWNLKQPCACLLIILPALSCNLHVPAHTKKHLPQTMSPLISVPFQVLIHVTPLSEVSSAIKWVPLRSKWNYTWDTWEHWRGIITIRNHVNNGINSMLGLQWMLPFFPYQSV